MARLFDGRSEKYASTILEAIGVAVTRLHERSGAYGPLYVFSDMLQVTPGPGGFNFEKHVPRPQDFVSWVKKSGLAADLHNIPLLVCGLHTGQFGLNSAAQATRLHDLWQRTLQSMGAPEIKLYTSCDAAFAA